MTKEQKIEIRAFLILNGFRRSRYTDATMNSQRYTERWVSKGEEDVVMLHWKIEHKIKQKNK
jgi:hypothetical protein